VTDDSQQLERRRWHLTVARDDVDRGSLKLASGLFEATFHTRFGPIGAAHQG
jgi:hypothetical protein